MCVIVYLSRVEYGSLSLYLETDVHTMHICVELIENLFKVCTTWPTIFSYLNMSLLNMTSTNSDKVVNRVTYMQLFQL